MKIVSWNVNSLRRRMHPEGNVLGRLLQNERPDVVCLQELQCKAQQVPYDRLREAGYQALICAQKGKNGTAILTPIDRAPLTPYALHPWPPPAFEGAVFGEARFCAAKVHGVVVASVYVPFGQTPEKPGWNDKLRFFQALTVWSQQVIQTGQCLLLAGDMNVAPSDADWRLSEHDRSHVQWSAYNTPQAWAAWCHPVFRDAYRMLCSVGLDDLGEHLAPRAPTLFDERNFGRGSQSGLRVDLFLGSLAMKARLCSTAILSEARDWPRPSDHVPIVAKFREVHRIFASYAGSRLHGTVTPASDVDVKGLVLPTARDLLLGKGASNETVHRAKGKGEKNHAADVDLFFFAPLEFVRSLATGQPIAWEMLFAPPETHLPDTTAQGLNFLDAIRRQVPMLLTQDSAAIFGNVNQQMRHLLREIGLRRLQPPYKDEDLLAISSRSDDKKKVAHALRILQQSVELYSIDKMTMPRPNADYLLAIKLGKISLAQAIGEVDAERGRLENLTARAQKRHTVDVSASHAAIESLLRDHLARPTFGSERAVHERCSQCRSDGAVLPQSLR